MGGTVGKQLGTEKAANQLQQDAAKTVDSTGVLSGSGTIIKDMQTGVDSWIQSGRDATSPWGESLFGTGDMSKIKFQNPFEGLGGGKDTPQEEPNMDQTTTSLPDNLTEDPLLTEPNIIPPEDEQEMDELSDLQDTEIAYYDISPTETQTISPNDNISLPDNYTVPDTVTDVFLNEDIT